jgi:hypothetical protein
VHPALTACTSGTFTITVDRANCASNLDPPAAPDEEGAAPPKPNFRPDPAKRKAAKAARKARRRSR